MTSAHRPTCPRRRQRRPEGPIDYPEANYIETGGIQSVSYLLGSGGTFVCIACRLAAGDRTQGKGCSIKTRAGPGCLETVADLFAESFLSLQGIAERTHRVCPLFSPRQIVNLSVSLRVESQRRCVLPDCISTPLRAAPRLVPVWP